MTHVNPLFTTTLSSPQQIISLIIEVCLPLRLIVGLIIFTVYAIKHYIYNRLPQDVQEKVSLWLILIFFLLFLCVYSGAGPIIIW